jgi:hypothetical protein
MVEVMGLKLLQQDPHELHHLLAKFHENLPSGSIDIHRSFIPKASNAFRLFLPTSTLALVAMVTSLPLCHFFPTVNYRPWLPQLALDVIMPYRLC